MAGKKQFDMDTALDAAMIQFWRSGYADTSIDDLSQATGLNRSSLYSSFGGKDTLFLRCLDRYAARYGDKYEAALSCAASDPLAAVRAFFGVTLERIADPALPDGCLVAQSAMAIPALTPSVAAHVKETLGLQHRRLRAALKAGRMTDQDAETFAVHTAAVNQSLAVMSRAGASPKQLLAIVGVTVDALAQALEPRDQPRQSGQDAYTDAEDPTEGPGRAVHPGGRRPSAAAQGRRPAGSALDGGELQTQDLIGGGADPG